MTPTAQDVRDFVVANLAGALAENGIAPEAVGDDFDLLTSGVIDSFGILELIADVNEHFDLDIDFEELDPEGLTIVGPFSQFIAQESAKAASA